LVLFDMVVPPVRVRSGLCLGVTYKKKTVASVLLLEMVKPYVVVHVWSASRACCIRDEVSSGLLPLHVSIMSSAQTFVFTGRFTMADSSLIATTKSRTLRM